MFNAPDSTPFQKDGIERYLIHGEAGAVNPERDTGTKAALHYQRTLAPGETWVVKLRLIKSDAVRDKHISLDAQFDEMFAARKGGGRVLRNALAPDTMDRDTRSIQRQAFAGMLWNKQFYNYVVERWLDGDPGQPSPAGSDARADATTIGATSSTTTCSACPTRGNFRGSRRGTWRSTRCRWR